MKNETKIKIFRSFSNADWHKNAGLAPYKTIQIEDSYLSHNEDIVIMYKPKAKTLHYLQKSSAD